MARHMEEPPLRLGDAYGHTHSREATVEVHHQDGGRCGRCHSFLASGVDNGLRWWFFDTEDVRDVSDAGVDEPMDAGEGSIQRSELGCAVIGGGHSWLTSCLSCG